MSEDKSKPASKNADKKLTDLVPIVEDRTQAFNTDALNASADFSEIAGDQSREIDQSNKDIVYTAGDVIDGIYKLTSRLGAGGMGAVFACTHTALDKDYAIKLLSGRGVTAEMWNRFQKEAKVLARLNHPGIVSIHNMGIDGGKSPYYVMDLLTGESLDGLIKRVGALPINQALDIFIQVAQALGSAHSRGIIHRDIKPSNLMLIKINNTAITRVKIVDFGIARWSKQALGSQSQTATGMTVGTPYYMSPEQCQGSSVDARSDIYSMGCALFQTLTGSVPFQGENAFQTFIMHQTDTPPRLTSKKPNGDFSPELEMAIEKMLRKNPASRYQSTAEVEQILEAIKSGSVVTKKRVNLYSAPSAAEQTFANKQSAGLDRGRHNQDQDEFAGVQHNELGVNLRNASLIVLTVAVLIGLVGFGAMHFFTPAVPKVAPVATDDDEATTSADDLRPTRDMLRKLGCSDAQITYLRKYDYITAGGDQDSNQDKFKDYANTAVASGQHFINKDHSAFNFPPDMIIGYVSFGDSKPVPAAGRVRIVKGGATFYQSYCLRDNPNFIDLFKPNDLIGLELTAHHKGRLLEKIQSWKGLENLSFFNSLTRPFPGYEHYDESRVSDDELKVTDDLPRLKILGICGPKVSGPFVAKLPVMKRLESLRIKNIAKYQALLAALPQFDNLKEIWLMGMPVDDAQLEPLTRMKNLQSLYISRTNITPAAIEMFKKMPHLKKIRLTNSLTLQEKQTLQKLVPDCTFEEPILTDYWQVLPTRPVSEYFKDSSNNTLSPKARF